MKKRFLSVCLFFFVLSLTGCVKYNATMDIKKDKSMDFSIVYAVDTSVFGDKDIIDVEQKNNLTKKGFTVSDYLDGNMKGVSLSKNIKNIDSVSSTSDVDYSLSGIMDSSSDSIFNVKKGFLKNTYTAKFNFNASDSGLNGTEDQINTDDEAFVNGVSSDYIAVNDNSNTAVIDNSDAVSSDDLNVDTEIDSSIDMPDFSSALASSMDLSFNVKLPYAAISNNATSVSDNNKSLSWTLTNDSINSIEFSFELYNLNNIFIAGGIGLLALILLIVIIIVVSKRGKGKKETVVPDTSTEIPDLGSSNSNFAPFSEQDFNKQLMAQDSQNVVPSESVKSVPNVEPIGSVPSAPVQPVSSVESVGLASVGPSQPSSIVQNLVPEVGLPPVEETPQVPTQTSVSEPNDIFNSNFEFITDVPNSNVETLSVQPVQSGPVQVAPSIQPVQSVVQETNSVHNIFEQPIIQDVPVPSVQPVQSVSNEPVQNVVQTSDVVQEPNVAPMQSAVTNAVPTQNVQQPVESGTIDIVEDINI